MEIFFRIGEEIYFSEVCNYVILAYNKDNYCLVNKTTVVVLYINISRYPTALAMVASGQVNVKPLVTHHFPLEESLQAFETARTGAGGAIKVVIDCFKK